MVSQTYTVTELPTEFYTFTELAEQLIVKYSKKVEDRYFNSDHHSSRVLALYMMGHISRYAVVKSISNHWSWEKSLDSLILTEILQEADKYKPEYKGEYHETPSS